MVCRSSLAANKFQIMDYSGVSPCSVLSILASPAECACAQSVRVLRLKNGEVEEADGQDDDQDDDHSSSGDYIFDLLRESLPLTRWSLSASAWRCADSSVALLFRRADPQRQRRRRDSAGHRRRKGWWVPAWALWLRPQPCMHLISVVSAASLACAGNESRFINDHRGIAPQPNVEFFRSVPL